MLISKQVRESQAASPQLADVNFGALYLLFLTISHLFFFFCLFPPNSSSRHPSVPREPSQGAGRDRQPALSRWGDTQPPAGLAEERHGHRDQAVQTAHPSGYGEVKSLALACVCPFVFKLLPQILPLQRFLPELLSYVSFKQNKFYFNRHGSNFKVVRTTFIVIIRYLLISRLTQLNIYCQSCSKT